jgi:hypothetical protein
MAEAADISLRQALGLLLDIPLGFRYQNPHAVIAARHHIQQ